MERRLSFAVSDTDEVSMNLSHSFGAADASTSRKRQRISDDNFVSPQAYLRAKGMTILNTVLWFPSFPCVHVYQLFHVSNIS
jgi:hypothetical protein